MSDSIDKKDLFDAIKHGHVWHKQKIVEYLNELQKKLGNDVAYMHEIKWDANEDIHYIYCNEYTLFISDGAGSHHRGEPARRNGRKLFAIRTYYRKNAFDRNTIQTRGDRYCWSVITCYRP